MNNYNYTNLPPFKWFVLENFPFIEADFDALTNWQLFCKLGKEINKIIGKLNATGEQVEILTDYFNNLDVQEEINNKLDEMAESGELSEIITQYLEMSGLLCFNTLNDLKNADNLIDGSFAKTFGNLVYNDGLGEFYKIRTILNTDVVDNNNLVALNNYNNLIAEKIKDIKYINLENRTINNSNINLENYITYDFNPNSFSQGSCIDDNGNLYVYFTENNIIGEIKKFNQNAQLVNTISNVQFYHGNSLQFKDNKIYAAACNTTKTICILDLTNNQVSEITPFENVLGNNIFAVTNFDENNILCGIEQLGNDYNHNFTNIKLYKLNIINNEIEEISLTNTSNSYIDFLAIQSFSYRKNKLYFLVSQPNMIIEFILINGIFNLNKFYNLPLHDNLGLRIGEFEDISYINGTESFAITSHILDTTGIARTLKEYFINFENNNQSIYYRYTLGDNILNRDIIYCNSNANNNIYYENGSQQFPFKRIKRAVENVNFSKLTTGKQILISGGTYYLGYIYNVDFDINYAGDNSGDVNFEGETNLTECNISLLGDNKFIFKEDFTINTKYVGIFDRCTFNKRVFTKMGHIKFSNCTFNEETQDVIPLRIQDGAIANVINNIFATLSANYVYLTGGSLLISNIDSNKITKDTSYNLTIN